MKNKTSFINDYRESQSDSDLICAVCGSPEIREVFIGDEGLTMCPECGAIEQGYMEGSKWDK